MVVQSWKNVRTLGELRQAVCEAEETLRVLESRPDAEEVYLYAYGDAPACDVVLTEMTLSDNSKVYNIEIRQ